MEGLIIFFLAVGIILPAIQLYLATKNRPNGWLKRRMAGYMDYAFMKPI